MAKLIPLEEVEKIFNKYNISTENGIREKILSLPTIDPIEEIDEMIEEWKWWNSDYSWNYLEELKSRLYPPTI